MSPQHQVLEYLKNGNSLTVFECWQRFHTTELRRIISRLKKEGHCINGPMIMEDGSRFKRYHYIGKIDRMLKQA